MTWERALEADARLAAKNAVLIRAALRQSFDAERAFIGYQNTQPDDTLTLAQQRVRSRSWAIMNIRPNLEPLRQVLYKLWAEAYVLGDLAAREAIVEMKKMEKADVGGIVDWSKWKPGDAASAVLLKPPRAFQRLLEGAGITLKGFSDTTLTDIGNAIGEAIELGLDAKRSAKNIIRHVANPARALSIAITEQNRAISTATQNRYLEAGLRENRWLVFQPCKICAENEGKAVPIGAPFPSGHTQPPAHPHCRCALASVPFDQRNPANTAGSVTEEIAPTEEAIQEPATDYRMRHQAPTRADEFGSPATDIGTEMMPGFYDNPRNFTTGMNVADRESTAVLMSIRNKPDELVTIYRAVPEGVTQINPGDWVTLSPSYAEQHLASNVTNGRVISMQIRARDLWFDGNSINEFGYDPVSKITSGVKELKDITPELKIMFKSSGIGKFDNPEIANELAQMRAMDLAKGASAGDNQLEMIAKLQKFDGKPKVVPAVTDLMKMQEAGQGKILWRGITDYSQVAEKATEDLINPPVTYSAQKAVDDFISGNYRAGWGSFGSGTYATNEISEAKMYAQTLNQAEGKLGNGKVIGMFLPKDARMPTEEVVKQTMRETDAFEGSYNLGRALAAKGYQAYDVGFVQSNKAGYYVILDRSVLTVAKEVR